jgi:hypothetical protein
MAIAVLALSILENYAQGDETFRGVLAFGIFASLLAPGLIYVAPAATRYLGGKNQPSIEDIALRIGDAYPELSDKLCNSIELIEEIDRTYASKELAAAAFLDAYKLGENKDFDVIIDKQKTKRTAIYFVSTFAAVVLAFMVFQSSLGASLYRIVNWNKSFLPPAPFSLSIYPTNASILRNEKVQITIKAKGSAPSELKLYMKETSQENYDSYVLKLDSGNLYHYELPSAKASLLFYAGAEWLNSEVKTQICTLRVIDKPIVKYFEGTLTYPGYARLAPKKFDEQGADLSALRGSVVSINLAANKILKSADIVYLKARGASSDTSKKVVYDTAYIKMKTDSKKAYGSFAVSGSGLYYLHLKDLDGTENDNPIMHHIYALSDEAPSIALLEPYGDAQVGEDAKLILRAAIADDYGFSSLKLHYRLVESKYTSTTEKFSTLNIPISATELTAEVPYLWDLNALGISPEDKYEYYLEVFDNDRFGGPKSAKTRIFTVRLPSLEEALKEADQAQKDVEKDMQKVIKQAEQLKKEAEELNRDLMKDQKPNMQPNNMKWEQKKKAEEIANKQKELQEKVEDIQKNMQNLTDKLQDHNVLSPETLQKYMELQKLMKEINSPELKKMQDKMRQAMDKLSPEQMQEALKNFKMDEEKFRQNIERTMKMLKKLQNEQKIDALTKKAEDLVNKLDDLNKKSENSNPNDQSKRNEIADKQNKLNDDFKDIAKDMDELEKSLKEMGKDAPNDKMKESREQMNEKQTSQEMNEAKQNSQSGNFSQAQKNRSKAKSNMQKFAQSMKNMKNSMQSKDTKEAIRKMQKATQDLSQLSKNQESLKNKTQNLDPNSTKFKETAVNQAENLSAMNSVLSSMFELSQKSFAVTPEMGKNLGEAVQEMQKSVQALSERNSQPAMRAQEKSMAAINKAMGQMQQMIGRMQKTGSCSNPGGSGNPQDGQDGQGGGQGMMQKLQQMAAQQQAINQAMQQAMGEGGSQGSMSREQQAKMQKLSGQQAGNQKSLEELNKEQKQLAGGKRKPMGDLEKIAKEMEEVANDMRNGQVTPETQKKQERILSRLLDATRSMTERDFEKQRQSNSGKDMFKNAPKNLDMSTQEGRSAALRDFLQSIKQGYNKDYETLIKQYFESIQK